jgi:hypothetical protein
MKQWTSASRTWQAPSKKPRRHLFPSIEPVEVGCSASWCGVSMCMCVCVCARVRRGGSLVFLPSANNLPLSYFISLPLSSSLSSLIAPVHAEGLPHHHRNHYLILIWFCHVGSCFGTSCVCLSTSLSSRFIIFLIFKVRYLYATPASPARIFPIYVVLSHGFGATSNSCVSTENSEMKVELTLLIAAMCKSRCGARAISHVHPRSVPAGPRLHGLPNGRVTVGLVVPCWRVTAYWGG